MDLIEAKYSEGDNSHHPWEYARIEVIYTLLKKQFPNLTGGKCTIADIGCGDVFLVEQLSKRLPQAVFYAIDIAFTPEELDVYKSRFSGTNICVFRSLEEAKKEFNGAFDLVLLLDVIEHIENVPSFFKELCSQLKTNTGTNFIITVPAFQSLFTVRDTFLRHYRRYTSKTLRKVILQSGLKPDETGYFFFSLLPLRAFAKIIESFKKIKPENLKGIGGWKESKLKDRFIKFVLVLDFRISYALRKTGIRLPGLSNYVIAVLEK